MKNIKAIIFDLDNTLGNRYQYAYQMYKDILLNKVKDITKDPFEFEAMLQDLYTYDEYGNNPKNDVFERFNKKYGININLQPNIIDYWEENFGRYCVPFAKTIETLQYLKTKYKLGIITNGHTFTQNQKAQTAGFKEYFDDILVSQDINCQKPDIRIFQEELKRLNVKAQEAIYVGDTFSLDILGAYKAGIKPIWMVSERYRPVSCDVTIIHSIEELKDLL